MIVYITKPSALSEAQITIFIICQPRTEKDRYNNEERHQKTGLFIELPCWSRSSEEENREILPKMTLTKDAGGTRIPVSLKEGIVKEKE